MHLQVRYPDRIMLIRGNHESRQITQVSSSKHPAYRCKCPSKAVEELVTCLCPGACYVSADLPCSNCLLTFAGAAVRHCLDGCKAGHPVAVTCRCTVSMTSAYASMAPLMYGGTVQTFLTTSGQQVAWCTLHQLLLHCTRSVKTERPLLLPDDWQRCELPELHQTSPSACSCNAMPHQHANGADCGAC